MKDEAVRLTDHLDTFALNRKKRIEICPTKSKKSCAS